jgi:predicted aminopeptidase|tara:strand:+ start:502 stop:1515 length:1014 start_codon:yes stop_codon:yes gene_type:complete
MFFPKLISFLLLAFFAIGLTGCSTAKYYSHAVVGHLQLTTGLTPIRKVIKQDETNKELRRQLELVTELRDFAENKLSLDVGKAYSKYKHLDRSAAAWVVYAAPPFSTKLQTWKYPIVGEYQSKGFFKERMAKEYSANLQSQGFDVYVGEAIAYSTLGWFNDPLLSTFLDDTDEELAETLFHELTHRTYYLKGDTMFNESFATTFAQKSVQLWLKEKGEDKRLEKYRKKMKRRDEFRSLLQEIKNELSLIYKNTNNDSEDILQKRKQDSIQSFKATCTALRKKWNSPKSLESWIDEEINNAKIAATSVYLLKVPYFNQLWDQANQDPNAYLEMVKALK